MLFPFSFRHHVLDWVLLRTHGHVRCPDKISRRRNKHGTGYARRERGRQRFTSGSGFPILFSKPADTPLLHRLNIVMAVCTIGLLFRSAASRMAWPRNTSPKLAWEYESLRDKAIMEKGYGVAATSGHVSSFARSVCTRRITSYRASGSGEK